MLIEAREAEAAIVGAVLLRNECLAEVEGELDATDFDVPAHRAVFDAMRRVAKQGQPIDIVTLEHEMRSQETLGLVGGLEGLGRLADRTPGSRHVMAHVELVREAARRRRARDVASELRDNLALLEADTEGLVEDAMRDLAKLLASRRVRRTGGEAARAALEHAKARMRGERAAQPITTGIETLDAAIRGGLEPGRLYIVAARPGNGKTALALCMQIAAAKTGAPTFGIHLEMTELDLGQRLLSTEGLVDLDYVECPTLGRQVDKLIAAHDRIDPLPIELTYDRITAKQSRSEIRAWRRSNRDGIGVVVVDYLQLHDVERTRAERRDLELAEWTAAYKGLAKELGVAIVLCCQLNREVERREDKRPRVSDLRESGAIEQDADAILLLYRPANYHEGKDIHECHVIVGKQRQGATSTVRVRFEPYFTRFLDEPEPTQEENDGDDEPRATTRRTNRKPYAGAKD